MQRRRWVARTDSFARNSDNRQPAFGIGIDNLWRDLIYAARGLKRAPVFSIATLLTLALGIGANTAVFSVVNAIIFRPLPVRAAHRLGVIASIRSSTSRLGPVSFPDLQDYQAATRDVFEDIAGYSVGFIGFAVQGARPDRVLVTEVTGNYFSLLGIQPAHGRLIRPDEGLPGRADPVVVLGYSAWHRRFGGDPSVIGRKAMLNGQPCTIVGVVPAEFVGTFAFSESEIYLPINWAAAAGLDDRRARSSRISTYLSPRSTPGSECCTCERLCRPQRSHRWSSAKSTPWSPSCRCTMCRA